MEPEKINLTIPVELVIEEGYYIISTTDESEEMLGAPICVQGNSHEDAIKQFWSMLKFINEYNTERSNELNKWKLFQKGDWSHIGGSWFTILGIHMYFRYGNGMMGGWYVPFTKLNIIMYNYWIK